MPRVAVIIPTWNGRTLLAACLEALTRQSEQDFLVVVVDNGSTDGTTAWLRECYPAIQLVANDSNAGFARAANQGIRATRSPYLAVLNNDTEPGPKWLQSLLAAAETDPRVGMVASKMLFADRPDTINSAGICVDVTGIAWDRLGGTADTSGDVQLTEIFGACGGAALYRRQMLEEVGLFDESFFAYLEDVDLAWRGRAAGWRCLYTPEARVLHRHSATAVEGSPFKRYQLGRNKIWLLAKNYPIRQLWWGGALAVLYDLAAVFYALIAQRDLYALRGRIAGLVTVAPRIRQRGRYRSRPDVAFLSPLAPPWRVSARYAHLKKSNL